MIRKMILLGGALLVLMAGSGNLAAQGSQEHSKQVAIVCSDSSTASTRSLKGIVQTFETADIPITYTDINLRAEGAETARNRISQLQPDLVVSVGSPATLFIKEYFPGLPLVFSTVLNPETSGIISSGTKQQNITGASLDIPVDIQFQKFKMVYASIRKIGVIYTAQSERLIEEARQIAPGLGLELVALKIQAERDLPAALDSLCLAVDGIWTTVDDLIYTPQATKFMILVALRNKKPIMGFSPSFVQSGALLGLVYDYKDIGRRAGELALRYFHGEALSQIPVASPGVIYLHINLKTANQLGIEIDQSLVDISKEIYK